MIYDAASMLEEASTKHGVDLCVLVAETGLWASPEVARRLMAETGTPCFFPKTRRLRASQGERRGEVLNGIRLDDNLTLITQSSKLWELAGMACTALKSVISGQGHVMTTTATLQSLIWSFFPAHSPALQITTPEYRHRFSIAPFSFMVGTHPPPTSQFSPQVIRIAGDNRFHLPSVSPGQCGTEGLDKGDRTTNQRLTWRSRGTVNPVKVSRQFLSLSLYLLFYYS